MPSPHGRNEAHERLEVLSTAFGAFPEVTPLNARFVPGRRRVRLTVEVRLGAHLGGRAASTIIDTMESICPGLSRHACCGNSRLRQSFHAGGAAEPGKADDDDALDLAHLLEHAVIDLTHYIAEMRVCSGVTCGYREPVNRFDLFVESPDDRVSRLAASIACDLMNDLLRGAGADRLYGQIVRLARHAYRLGGGLLTVGIARDALGGDRQCLGALLSLARLGFVREVEAGMNFSGMPIYALAGAGDPLTRPAGS